MKRKLNLLLAISLLATGFLFGQTVKKDTIYIKASDLQTQFLRTGTSHYLVYFKMAADSVRTQTQFWTRTTKRIDYNGKPAIEINQSWEDKDSIMHIVKSISDAKTMQPLYHRTWWKVQVSKDATYKPINVTEVDFLKKTVEYNGKVLSDQESEKRTKAIWDGYKSSIDQYYLNWHLDLETFPLLPYKTGVTFIIPFHDPGTASSYQKVAYTVIGSAELIGFNDQKVDCWLLVHESPGNKEVFWVSKKTQEVLKLEQEINGKFYRYKIKLPFTP